MTESHRKAYDTAKRVIAVCDDLDPRRVWRTVNRDVPHLRAYLVDTVLPGLDR